MNRNGEMGVGTLIIFIALLLVAAVAAGVLIQTAGSLQQKALSTGTQATSQISTNALVLEVSATDGSTGQDIGNFSMVMKLAPGSDSMKLSDVTLTLNTVDDTTTYNYTTGAFTVNATAGTGTFAVTYMQNGSNHQDGVLVRGDVILVEFESPVSIGEGEYVRINWIPKIGTSTRVIFDTPDVISTQRVYLYP